MRRMISILVLGAVFLFLYVPILLLAVYSFTSSATIGAIRGFSVKNYVVLFTTPELLEMIRNTLVLALLSALIATALGTMGAIGSFYSKKKSSMVMDSLNRIPMVNADIVTGFSLCVLLIILLGIDKNTLIPLYVGHVTLLAPFVYTAVMPRLKQMDSALYEAALDLGCKPGQALFRVVLPQLIPGIVSGFVLAVTLSLDDYFITTYTKPSTFDTISTYVVNATKGSQTEIKTALWALSTVIFVLVILAEVGMNMTGGRGEDA